jgi:hypothetical protein
MEQIRLVGHYEGTSYPCGTVDGSKFAEAINAGSNALKMAKSVDSKCKADAIRSVCAMCDDKKKGHGVCKNGAMFYISGLLLDTGVGLTSDWNVLCERVNKFLENEKVRG